MDVTSTQSAIWFAEHKLRGLIVGRGMKPGRAIRRLFNTSDEETQALASLWVDGEFAVVLGDSEELFVAAYDAVRSCMHRKGALCHAAYSPHGVGIACVAIDGQITARTLVRGGNFVRTYGVSSFALAVFCRVIAGLTQHPDWCDFDPSVRALVAYELSAEKRKIPREVPLWSEHGETRYYLQIPSARVSVWREEVIFRPYVDIWPQEDHV